MERIILGQRKKSNFCIFFLFFFTISSCNTNWKNVEPPIYGTFTYCNKKSKAVIEFKKRKVVESFEGMHSDFVKVTSQIHWQSDTTYNLIVKKVVGKTNVTKGTKVEVQIISNDNSKVNVLYKFDDGFEGRDCFLKRKR